MSINQWKFWSAIAACLVLVVLVLVWNQRSAYLFSEKSPIISVRFPGEDEQAKPRKYRAILAVIPKDKSVLMPYASACKSNPHTSAQSRFLTRSELEVQSGESVLLPVSDQAEKYMLLISRTDTVQMDGYTFCWELNAGSNQVGHTSEFKLPAIESLRVFGFQPEDEAVADAIDEIRRRFGKTR